MYGLPYSRAPALWCVTTEVTGKGALHELTRCALKRAHFWGRQGDMLSPSLFVFLKVKFQSGEECELVWGACPGSHTARQHWRQHWRQQAFGTELLSFGAV